MERITLPQLRSRTSPGTLAALHAGTRHRTGYTSLDSMARQPPTGDTTNAAKPPRAAQAKLRQIVVEAVFRRKRIVALTVLLVLLATAALILLLPKQYKAEAKLMVQNVRAATPLSATAPEHVNTQDDVSPSEINSEVDLLGSSMVARRSLGAPSAGVQNRRTEEQIKELKHRFSVDAVHGTNLINLDYTAASPDAADRGLQKIIDAYFETRATNARSSGAESFFDRQLDAAKEDLDRTGKALTDYGLQHSVADLDDEKKLQLQRVSTLQDQIAQADAALALQRSRENRQQQQLISTPARLRTVERSITNQYSQERLNTSLVDLENRRAELVRRYAPSDRQILELDDKIANTKLAISDSSSKPATELASDINPLYQQLSAAVTMAAGEVSGTVAQRSTLQTQFDQAERRLDELENATVDVNALKRAQTQAQAEYTLYAQRKSDARISAQLDKEKLFDVSMVQPPFSTTDPVRPRPILYGATGLIFAFLAATLLAVYADTSSGYIYTPAQLDGITGSRTLATLASTDEARSAEEMNALEYRRLLFSVHKALQTSGAETSAFSFTGLDTPHGEWPRGTGSITYCLALTSATKGEGVSYVADQLAQEAARQFGSNVAVLDVRAMLAAFETERRNPDAHSSGTVSFGFQFLPSQGYWVLSTDPATATALRPVGSRGGFAARLCPWIERSREDMDLILLDCPANIESTLSSELESCIDGYVALVRAGRTRRPSIDQLSVILSDRRAPLLGWVLNRRRYPIPRWLHRVL